MNFFHHGAPLSSLAPPLDAAVLRAGDFFAAGFFAAAFLAGFFAAAFFFVTFFAIAFTPSGSDEWEP